MEFLAIAAAVGAGLLLLLLNHLLEPPYEPKIRRR